MRFIVFSFLLLIAAFVAAEDEKFLITFSPTDNGVWLTEAEVIQLAINDVGFMDKTLHQNPPIAPADPPTPPPLPNQPQQKTTVRELIEKLDPNEMMTHDSDLSAFPTRYYTKESGKQAAEYIFNTLSAYKGNRDDIEVEYFENPWLQPSVIARFKGNVKPQEIAILGAHEDSVSFLPDDAPGADDDGSGSSTNLEVFRVLSENGFKPNRTVEIHFYSAEEAGLKGSQLIAEDYFEQGKDVVAMLQLDMTYYVGTGQPVIGIVTDFTNATLTQFIRQCVEAYSDLPWVDTKCGYGCSDHASWTQYGYRAAFPFETPFGDRNPFIHTPGDTTEHVDVMHGLEFAKMALGYLVEVSATEYMYNDDTQ